ncbi:g12264 [Coccomyxa viridis]|uniref:G12264 protein n=1 Tax=Coccomyxa viridis TaxID=1274662 RepID=A0ABP1G9X8_9CHLO
MEVFTKGPQPSYLVPAQCRIHHKCLSSTSSYCSPSSRLGTTIPRHASSTRLTCIQGKSRDEKLAQRQKAPKFAPLKRSPSGSPAPPEQQSTWGFFQWDRYATPWEVPWGGKQVALGMVAWAASFLLVGLVLSPLIVKTAGVTNLASLTATDKSLLVLGNQVLETYIGIAVIRTVLKGFEPFPEDLFSATFRGPFRKPNGWLTWGLLGVVLSPVVIGLTVTALTSAGYEPPVGGQGTADGVARIISLDFFSYASLFTTTAVLAPILEETVFRGFLLTSLSKFMPTPAAVVVSSVAFGAAHLSQRDLPQLVALGILLGFSYVRSRNLATPMLIHGAWNGTVLTVLFLLAASGVDVKQLIANS